MKMDKVHGSENNFFLIDELLLEQPLTAKEIEDLRVSLCHQETGLLGGADGLLLIEKADKSSSLAKMRVINSDGSEASMCGNGLRTVARYLAEKYNQEQFSVETMYAELAVSHSPDIGSGVKAYQVEISPVIFDTAAVPMNTNRHKVVNEILYELSETLRFSVVAVPNPHLISFVDHQTLWSTEFEKIASSVNSNHPLFPDGINVSFVEILDENQLFVRTYERGVGFTNACGTAMCASSLMYVLLENKAFEQAISVFNPGGMVKTIVHKSENDSYSMDLIGNATVTHNIEGELSELIKGEFSKLAISETEEQKLYLSFLDMI